ncbi:MAG: 4-alpha-glucanotransferase [Candidatus Moduliflexus flocculans]|nr:4-alpha-glucanotransferase [Candidatus Moduliflexus flocculans]
MNGRKSLYSSGATLLKPPSLRLGKDVHYHIFIQYLFFRQWDALRKYASGRGIRIIGDMPIYMAPDSADAWMGRDMLDKQGRVAGCPPDYFSETGQLWGIHSMTGMH